MNTRSFNPELLEAIRAQAPDFLQKARRTGYICPQCGNGSGKGDRGKNEPPSYDGITLDKKDKTGTHYKCFKCGLYADNLDLIGIQQNISSFPDQVQAAADFFGFQNGSESEGGKNPRKETKRAGGEQAEPPADYSFLYREAEASPGNYDYLKGRGISKETQKRFHVGYIADWKSPNKYPENTIATPRVIIPRSKSSYLARFAGSAEELRAINDGLRNTKLNSPGAITLFNEDALKERIVFVVEGEIDAMSIEEAGGHCVGLCSAANRRKIVERLKESGREDQAIIVMLDNDEAGNRAADELTAELQKVGIFSAKANFSHAKAKDPNEWLVKDAREFKKFVSFCMENAEKSLKSRLYGNKYCAAEILEHFRNIEEQPEAFEVKTGFSELDREDRNLYGGLHEGLYILGAVSSLGKTTFCLQLAEQIAAAGQDVLFFSLEQSKEELIAKGLSRRTFTKYRYAKDRKDESGHYIARDTSQIMNNNRYKFYSDQEKAAIAEAIEDYAKAAGNYFYIYEGRYKGERLTVKHIAEIVKQHIENPPQRPGRKNTPPVVFVDYLQIIAPEDVRATDKQNTDTNVFELKEISRNYKIPVFAISSFNRENYKEPVSMTSFKESGAVEYSSDVLFGLQYAGMDYKEGEKAADRLKRIREIINGNRIKAAAHGAVEVELKCLKNRNGGLFKTNFYFTPAYNHYSEMRYLKDEEKTPFSGLQKTGRKRNSNTF